MCVRARVIARRTHVYAGWTRACAFRKIVAPVTPTLGYRLTVTLQTYNARVSYRYIELSRLVEFIFYARILFIFGLGFFLKKNCRLSEDDLLNPEYLPYNIINHVGIINTRNFSI